MKKKYIILTSLFVANLFFWYSFFSYVFFHTTVSYLPVGQGDSELIQTKAGNILIDSGPDGSILSALGKTLNFYDKTIDVFALTNQDIDHYQGLFDVLKRYRVRVVMVNDNFADNETFRNLLQEIQSLNIPVVLAARGAEIDLNGNKLSVIYPMKNINQYFKANKNQLSVVTEFLTDKHSFLFGSDIDKKAENILKNFIDKTYDVFKVAHHGSKTSNTEQFLNVIQPKYSIIEVGKNTYGHPADETLERLDIIGSQIFRTDKDGLIRFVEDIAKGLKIKMN